MESVSTFKLFGLTFNPTNLISVTITALLVFVLVYVFSRNLKIKPTGKQNALEWFIDFTNGIVKGAMDESDANRFGLYAFTLFLFIFISNEIGLFLQLGWNGETYFRSPTADPIVTLTLSLMTMSLAHFSGVAKFGFKKYVKNTYLAPYPALLPINIFTEFIDFVTLGLRIYGVIFAGEMLLKLIAGMAFSSTLGMVAAIPVELLWQGFSLFLGGIQAFVFVTLSSVYISHKVEGE